MPDEVVNFTQVFETVTTIARRPVGDIDAALADQAMYQAKADECGALVGRLRAAGAIRRSELTPEQRAQLDAQIL